MWPRLKHHDGLDAYARRIIVRMYLAERRLLWRKQERLTDLPPDTDAPSDVELEERMIVRRAPADSARSGNESARASP